ncbi:MAG: hypothetical protein U5J98_12540 [Halobacteriales archaeon]|nr:hypothetical protein [Halobacteriales archaeon]
MHLGDAVAELSQPAWLTAFGTAGGYALLLLLMTVLLFGLPYLVFTLL